MKNSPSDLRELRYWACYTKYAPLFDDLSDAELGRLVRALTRYTQGGCDPPPGRERSAFRVIAQDIDRTRRYLGKRSTEGASFNTDTFFLEALARSYKEAVK